MSQRTVATAPSDWQIAVEVDSRLEADLVVRMLGGRDVEALAVQLGDGEFGVYVAEHDRNAADLILDVQ
jgi:hypothetical protein